MALRSSPNRRPSGDEGPDGLPSIDGFTVEAVVGEGGFSQVYRGIQDTPERPVALKVFRTSGKIGSRVRERFKRESDVIGGLSSEDGLVTVFTGGFTSAGAPYLSMELCEGGSIADRIRSQGALPVGEVVAVGERIGSALAIVHSQGVAHRDVKPSNILLKADGRALLTDFGLAVVDEMTEALGEESRLAMTEVYAPPERLNPTDEGGAPTDAAGDQYSFALTLYAMLLGGSPFTGETTTQRALKALQGQIEPLSRRDVPPALVEVLRRALASRPSERWPSMAEFVAALRSIGVPETIAAPPEAPSSTVPSGSSPHGRADGSPQASPWWGAPAAGASSGTWPPVAPNAPAPAVPGLTDDVADAPTSMPGATPQSRAPVQPPPSAAPPAQPLGGAPAAGGQQSAFAPAPPHTASAGPLLGGAAAANELANDATRMPQRDPGISVIEAPPAPEPKVNPKRNLYIGGAVAASVVLVLIIGAVVLRGGSPPEPSPETAAAEGEEATGGEVGVALVPPTIDKLQATNEGLAFTWDGDDAGKSYPVYKVQVDGADMSIIEPITDADSGGWVREEFVNSVTMDDGTEQEIDTDQHEYCITVSLFPADSDGPESVHSEQKCLGN